MQEPFIAPHWILSTIFGLDEAEIAIIDQLLDGDQSVPDSSH